VGSTLWASTTPSWSKGWKSAPGQLALISDNRAYETILVDAGTAAVRILGRVVQLQRRI
jgi:SOS-response transcriptional repressor LexA